MGCSSVKILMVTFLRIQTREVFSAGFAAKLAKNVALGNAPEVYRKYPGGTLKKCGKHPRRIAKGTPNLDKGHPISGHVLKGHRNWIGGGNLQNSKQKLAGKKGSSDNSF
ncbi:hypothetical protein C5167_006560 [Papaver somniferum]|uniref:Uncharacterized protein n=1 Tax=Papaver somniferum TaxID=3469 RepID=A0A4Y7JDM2_PAPSO|nr:hypothetical protein C5167_006560 [Papaver somniferum]